MVDVYLNVRFGREYIESRGYEFAIVIECRLGAVVYFRAVGLAVEVELVGGFAHDVVVLAFGAAYVLSEVACRNGYPGDFAAQGEFLGRSVGIGVISIVP